jgi:DNA-3-methyladenine glycosylase I
VSEREMGIEEGPDGRPRCWWCLGTEDYLAYHDDEWGRPLHGEVALFERLTLEAFQSGLSWLTILRKRETSGGRSTASRSSG